MSVTVGREEWVALPDLGIPAIRAKVDTGAQTSSLHAFAIHRLEIRGRARVRFGVHPLPEQPDVELFCEAELLGERHVTSSNGETELRYVIAAHLSVGGRQWPIEISLTNRERMAYRMLLGRQALEAGVLVDVTRACLHGIPDLSVYDTLRHAEHANRPLRIALLAGRPGNEAQSTTAARLTETGAARGHDVKLLDIARCSLAILDGRAQLRLGNEEISRPDAVIALPEHAVTRHFLAVLRALEAIGVRCINGSSALATASDPARMIEALLRRGIAMPPAGFAMPHEIETTLSAIGGLPAYLRQMGGDGPASRRLCETGAQLNAALEAGEFRRELLMLQKSPKATPIRRCLVAGRRVVAAVGEPTQPQGKHHRKPRRGRPTRAERALARRAAHALGLRAAVVDLIGSDAGPLVLDVTSLEALEVFEDASGVDVAGLVLAELERIAGRGDISRNRRSNS